MFARKYPNSGSIKTLLSDIDKRVEDWLKPGNNDIKTENWEDVDLGLENNSDAEKNVFSDLKVYNRSKHLPGGSVRAMAAVCTQIALENVDCAHYALRVLSRMVDSLKDEEEKWEIIDKVYSKLCNQPNSTYNQLWLQNITYQKDKKNGASPYSLRLCQLVAGRQAEPLWNNEWLKPELLTNIPYDSVVDGETLKKVTPVITFRETRTYIESAINEGYSQ